MGPVIGPSAELDNFYLCNGFSGHGFKLAPAVGSVLSQQITGSVTESWETTMPLDFMDPVRAPLTLKVTPTLHEWQGHKPRFGVRSGASGLLRTRSHVVRHTHAP